MAIVRQLILMLCVTAAASCAAAPQLLLVDRSGSMAPYVQDGVLFDLVQKVRQACREQGPLDEAVFATKVLPVPAADSPVTPQEVGGHWTYLDEAANHALRGGYQLFWLITDNVQEEPGSPEAGQTEKFYGILRSRRIRRVVIFPILHVPGRRGLAVYAVLLSPGWRERLSAQLGRFQSLAQSYQAEPLLMKPLDREAFEVEYLDLPGQQKKKITHQTGQQVRQEFRVRFRSRYGHLCIQNAEIRQATEEELKTAWAEKILDFGPGSLLQPERLKVTATPSRLDAICPGQQSASHAVEVDFGRVRLRPSLRGIWLAATGRPRENIDFDVPLMISVQQQAFRFQSSFLSKYHANSLPEAAQTGKVYGIQGLPSLLAESETHIYAGVPLQFQVTYPWWPAVLLAAVFLAAVAVLFYTVRGIYRGWRRPSPWQVQAVQDEREIPARIDQEGTVMVGERTVGYLRDDRFEKAPGIHIDSGAAGQIRDGKTLWLVLPGSQRTKVTFFRGKLRREGREPDSSSPLVRR
jgi:hypothetical protein